MRGSLGVGGVVFASTLIAAPPLRAAPKQVPASAPASTTAPARTRTPLLRLPRFLPKRNVITSAYIYLGPSWLVNRGARRPSAAIDLELGARIVLGQVAKQPITLWPVVAYTWDSGDSVGGHFIAGGLGIAAHLEYVLTVAIVSRFVFGSLPIGRALGTRTGIRGELLFGVIGVEIAHQYLTVGGRTFHSMRLVFGFDLAQWIRLSI